MNVNGSSSELFRGRPCIPLKFGDKANFRKEEVAEIFGVCKKTVERWLVDCTIAGFFLPGKGKNPRKSLWISRREIERMFVNYSTTGLDYSR